MMQTQSRGQQETLMASGIAPEVRQVLVAISHAISLERMELPDEFYPSHLPVALISAVYRTRLGSGAPTTSSADRYCHHFGIASMRARSWKPLSADQQETLGDLVRRFDELGVDRMAKEVFQTNHGSTEATIRKAKNILRAAKVLRHIGIDVLQDIPVRRPDEIDDALQCLPEVSAGTIRRFLMYTGDDDFVRGDAGVRNFVSIALSRRAISGKHAEELVRRCAYELILAPRFLDFEIWKLRGA